MATSSRIGDIELNQDLEHEVRSRKVALLVRTIWIIVILAALLGLLGSGPLSRAKRTDPTGQLTLKYNRFERVRSPTKLEVQLRLMPTNSSLVHIWIHRQYVQQIEFRHIDPEPNQVEMSEDRFTYAFNVAPGAKEFSVVFRFELEEAGQSVGAVGVSGGPNIQFQQWIYP